MNRFLVVMVMFTYLDYNGFKRVKHISKLIKWIP